MTFYIYFRNWSELSFGFPGACGSFILYLGCYVFCSSGAHIVFQCLGWLRMIRDPADEEHQVDVDVESEVCPWCTPLWTCGLHSLGEAAPDVPATVHQSMEALVKTGQICRTTLSQRMKCKLTSGSEYGVSSILKEALKYGYIHPDLAPPRGLLWKCRAGSWFLAPRGG